MHSNKKVLIVAVVIMMMLSMVTVGPASSADPGGGLTIDDVSYSSGTISFSGSSQEADDLRFFVTYPNGTHSQYGSVRAANHTYAGTMELDLPNGQYSLTVFSSSTDTISRSFTVSEITISSASYDYDAGTLTFSGTAPEASLRFFVSYPDGSQSQYGSLQVNDGRFNGTMSIELPKGDYTLTVFQNASVKDTVPFSSSGTQLISVTVPSAVSGLVYNGQEQTGVPAEAGFTVSGGTAKDAGGQTATLSLLQGYVWSDGTTADKTVSWEISRAPLVATYPGESVIEGNNPVLAVEVTGFVSGESASNAEGYSAPTIGNVPSTVGSHVLTPSGGSATNYVFSYVGGTLEIIQAAVSDIVVQIPSARDSVYNGQEQYGVSSGDGYTISGNSAVHAGTYEAILTLKDGHVWSDNTKDPKQISWTISRANLTATYVSETITEGGTPSFMVSVTGFVDGESASDASHYVAPGVTTTDLSVGSHTLTPSGGSADDYLFTYVSGTLTVEQRAPSPGITLNKHSVTITVDSNETLTASLYQTGSSTVNWASSNPLIVSVGSDGKLTPKAYGKATITATSGNYSDRCEVTVEYAPLTLTKYSMELQAGSSDSLSVTIPSGYTASDVIWRLSNNLTSSGSGETVTVTAGSETGVGNVTVIIGNLYSSECSVSIIPKQAKVSTYTFTLRADVDADFADLGSSGYSISDLRRGISLSAESTDAGTALEKALNEAGIPCNFWSSADGTLKYWVENICGMGDVHLANGDWKYWIQYHNGSYNDWTLGYYTDGGSFEIVYGITSDPGQNAINAPTPVSGLRYNGSVQVGVREGTGYTVTGGSATNAGNYTATVTLTGNYTWNDGSKDVKTIAWSISKAELKASYLGETVEYGNEPSFNDKIRVTGFVNSETAATASGYIAPVVYTTDLSVGDHYLTPEGGSADNYSFVYNGGTLSVTAKTANVPSKATGLVYNGSTQIGVQSGIGYSVERGSAANAGSYTAVLSLSDGYLWSDGSTSDKEIGWSIAKVTLTATYVGETILEGSQPSYRVTVTGFVNGESASTASGYKAPTVSSSDLSVGSHRLTPSEGSAKNYDFRYVAGTLEVVKPSSDVHVHSWDSGTVTKQPTCKEEGVLTFTCSGCDETRTESVPKTAHSWSEWTIVKEATESEEGLKERNCSECGEKETSIIPKVVVVIDDEGNKTKTEEKPDGTTVTTTETTDGSVTIDTNKDDVDGEGNLINISTSETTDKDGNVTEKVNVITDADGNETYSKKENYVPETTRTDGQGNQITESSSKSIEKESGRTTEVGEKSTATVATDGNSETEVVRVETVTEADGSTSVTTVTDNTKKAADGSTETSKVTTVVKEDEGSILSSTQSESKDKDGNETYEKKVEAESKDGNVKSEVELPKDVEKAEIVTTVKTDSDDGNHAVTAEQVQQAIAIQEKVSQEISDDVKEQTKIIQVESATTDAALTVSQDAVKAVSDSGSGLKISSEKGSLTASSQVLSNISEEEEITISISEAKDEDMNDAQKETVTEEAVVVDVRIMSGDKSLGNVLGGTITISVKYTPATGKVAVAYYVDDSGGKEKMEGISYDPDNGEVSFESTHCSLYMIVDEESEKGDNSSNDSTMLYIGIAVAVIAVISNSTVVYMRKN